MYDLIIIGGGPAGLTAATYAVRKRLNCLLISPDLGGKTNVHLEMEGVDTYRVINGADVVRRFRNEIEYLDFARLLERVVKLEQSGTHFTLATASGRQFTAATVILATGAEAVRLDVPGAQEFFLRGVAYSTVSYAPLYVDRRVAVIGSGELAVRSAAELAQIAGQVYLIAPEAGGMDSVLGRRLLSAKTVRVFEGWRPAAIAGDTYVRQLTIVSPEGEQQVVDVDGIFVELGLTPNSELVRGWVELDEHRRVVVNCATETSVPGLFAAGDVTHLPAEQVLIAVGEGAKAALGAHDYLLRIADSDRTIVS